MSTVSISTAIRIALMILFVLALFQLLHLFDPYVSMRPDQIWPGFEFWRLFTYPIGRNFGGLLIGAIVFSQPGEEIESMMGKRRFGVVLLIVTLFVSLLYLLLFFASPGPRLAGPQNLALFVMVGYVYLFPGSSVRVIFFNVGSKVLLLIMALIAVAGTVYDVSLGESVLVFFGEGGAGLILGAIWFHVAYQKYPVLLGPLRALTGTGQKVRQERRRPVSAPRIPSRRGGEGTSESSRRAVSDEDRLDAILEQISRKGYESLTPDDRRFLDEYSSRL